MQNIKIEDLLDFRFLSSPTLSVDGKLAMVIFSACKPDQMGYRKSLQVLSATDGTIIWQAPEDGIQCAAFAGNSYIAYVHKEEDGTRELVRAKLDGTSEESRITLSICPQAIVHLGGSLFLMHTICEYREEKCNAGQGTDWEIVDELPFLENGRGYVSKTRRSLMLFDADNGDIVQITPKWFETASFSFLERFGRYVWGLITRLDLGTSYQTSQPVSSEIFARFPTTLLLALVSMLFAVGLGIPAGIISATRQYSLIDNISMVTALLGVSMPNFWQGLMNIIVFSIWLKWLPASGFYGWQYWILPALTIGTSSAALLTRMTRSSMLEVIRQDYIRTARAKGQKESKIIIYHALKNALIPIVTVVGIQFGGLLGGAVLTETVFAIPGVGKFMVDAIKARDYPIVQGGVLIMAVISSIVNLLVDVLYSFIDPRLKSIYKKRDNIYDEKESEKEVA